MRRRPSPVRPYVRRYPPGSVPALAVQRMAERAANGDTIRMPVLAKALADLERLVGRVDW